MTAHRRSFGIATGSACVLLAGSSFAGDVHVVSPSGPHTQIQAAIDAASDFDTILVKPHALASSSYNGFVIRGKSLAIVGDPLVNQPVNVRGEMRIEATPPGGLVLLGSLQCRQAANLAGNAFRSTENAGSIRVEKCTLAGDHGIPHSFERASWVGLDSDTQFLSSTLTGGGGSTFCCAGSHGQTALYSLAPALRLFGCELYGGDGSTETDEEGGGGGHGGHGLRVDGGLAFAADCTLHGGDGSYGAWDKDDIFDCQSGGPGGWGGDGLRIGTAQVFTLTSAMDGGSPGSGGVGCSGNGPSGQPGLPVRVDEGGAYQNFANGKARYLSGTPLARGQGNVALTAKGVQGDRVYVAIEVVDPPGTWPVAGTGPHPLGYSQKPTVVFLGTIPATGTLSTSIPAGAVGFGNATKWWRLYSTFVLPTGVVAQGNDFIVAIVRPSF
jgi:hypothetical protein